MAAKVLSVPKDSESCVSVPRDSESRVRPQGKHRKVFSIGTAEKGVFPWGQR